MQLPAPGPRWDARVEAAARDILMRADAQNLKRGHPAEVAALVVDETLMVVGAATFETAITAPAFILDGAADMTAVSYSGAGGQKHVLIGRGDANQNVVFFILGVEQWRVNASGHLVSDANADIGDDSAKNPASIYADTKVKSASFMTDSATVSCLNNTATTVYALPDARALWLVRVSVASGGASLYGATALVMVADGSARVAVNGDAANAFITVSGLNLQVRQTSGTTNNVSVTLVRISG